jgi:hypothetical protein
MIAKRGRKSSIDLLPEEAWPHVKAALTQLADNKRTAESIREELNLRLADIPNCSPISSSAFNRKSLQLAKIGADISRAREMAAVFADKVNEMPDGDIGMLINEMCKVIIYNMTAEMASMDMDVAAKMMKEISLATYRLEQAGAISAKKQQIYIDHAKGEAAAAVKVVAREQGMSEAMEQFLVDKVLGIDSEKPAP